MIDQTVVRGKTKNGRYAFFNLKIDAMKLFSEYGMEYIRSSVKILLAESVVHMTKPEELDKRISEVIGSTCADAAHDIAVMELKSLANGGLETFRNNVMEIVTEVMEGRDEE